MLEPCFCELCFILLQSQGKPLSDSLNGAFAMVFLTSFNSELSFAGGADGREKKIRRMICELAGRQVGFSVLQCP